ncbi:MAG: hypothetical protein KF746_10685 [Chitinophagaceae bacterium]|nr:hypothetical protein [Chitinophagaceae bacterium]
MENISVLTDFDQVVNTGRFTQINAPEGYSVYIGGNFIFISNAAQRTVRFSLANFDTNVSSDAIHEWIGRIKKLYPGF